jgi:hypothetical protein
MMNQHAGFIQDHQLFAKRVLVLWLTSKTYVVSALLRSCIRSPLADLDTSARYKSANASASPGIATLPNAT